MKTAIILTTFLGTDDYLLKTKKFLKYYTQSEVMKDLGINPKDIWLVDNNSPPGTHYKVDPCLQYSWKYYEKHYTRPSHLTYPYCWRALYFARELFQEHDYEKVIFVNNDSFIISKKLAEYLHDYKSGWWTSYCKKHNFPECEIQVITKDCKEYWEVTGPPYESYNGKPMERCIKPTVEKEWIGDRHSEYGITTQESGWDYSTQVKLDMEIRYNG